MTFGSELFLLNGPFLGVSFGRWEESTVTHTIVPFSVSVLAVATNKVETAI